MAGFEMFEREIRLATAGLEPEAINAQLAAFAKQELRRLISSGQASPIYERYVNNVRGLPEEAVQVPNGIVYQFVNWSAVLREALEELRKRSPKKSGRFASSFLVFANQALVHDYAAIPADAEVIVTNSQPYIRKVEGGGFMNSSGSAVFDRVKNVLARRYRSAFSFDMKYLRFEAGLHPDMPYILKRGEHVRMAAQNNRSSAFRAGRSELSRRKDRQPGQPITYPSIIINVA